MFRPAWGKAQHGKKEVRKELAYIAIAHRGVYVHQSSQASASHLIAGVLKGLKKRRPVLINVYTPCPVEHGLADDWSQHASRLALESRAFPFLTYDPDGGSNIADCLTLEGNPSLDTPWPSYELRYVDDAGAEQLMELPLTIADWAATEARFKQHFKEVPAAKWDDTMVPFHEYLLKPHDERQELTPFIWATTADRKLRRLRVTTEIAVLAEERLQFWSQLRQLAGLEVSGAVHAMVASEVDAEYRVREAAMRADFERQIVELKASYPAQIARRLAEGLLKNSGGSAAIADLLASLPAVSPGFATSAPGAVAGNGAVAAVAVE